MRMLDKNLFAVTSLAAMLLVGCGGKEQAQNVPPALPAPIAAPAPTPEAPKEKPVYIYSGDRFRDPFTPAGQTNSYQADAVFDPQKATVKGIIFGSSQKSAVLTVGGSGTYFIKAGRIFDIMGKAVEGYSAKIYVDKVVVLGEADNVYELKIKKTDEEDKKS